MANNGYPHPRGIRIQRQNLFQFDSTLAKQTRARPKAVNERMENINVIRQIFCLNVPLRVHCFHTVVNLTALMIENDGSLFERSIYLYMRKSFHFSSRNFVNSNIQNYCFPL